MAQVDYRKGLVHVTEVGEDLGGPSTVGNGNAVRRAIAIVHGSPGPCGADARGGMDGSDASGVGTIARDTGRGHTGVTRNTHILTARIAEVVVGTTTVCTDAHWSPGAPLTSRLRRRTTR